MTTYRRQKYLFMTLDPVHIGTGGYRLGRVDNSIVREPGTRIPKIPGTSLHGAACTYAAQLHETPEAAGQSKDKVVNPDKNPICYTFGYIKKVKSSTDDQDETMGYSGVVNIFDAHIVLFPVHSMVGPVWVTTMERLKEAKFTVKNGKDSVSHPPNMVSTYSTLNSKKPINLGWLMVNIERCEINIETKYECDSSDRWKSVKDKIVIVNESLFSQIVNSNLEVRTSVSINPETGAAEEGALFTYEAIPRATFLTSDVVLDNYRSKDDKFTGSIEIKKLPNINWKSPLDVVKDGFKMMEWLGVGGMGTRGFGRIAIVGEPIDEYSYKEKNHE